MSVHGRFESAWDGSWSGLVGSWPVWISLGQLARFMGSWSVWDGSWSI